MADKGLLMAQLAEKVASLEPLPGEEEFFTSPETLVRFLKARDWKLPEAEKMLISAIEWRRSHKPLEMDCRWCHEKPGFHSMRQVGFDEMGRPVIYSSFIQATTSRNSVDDSVAHTTYLIENAKRTMPPGVSTWVFVIDCTGMNLQACNPRLGHGVTQIMSNQYPERLGLVFFINHNPVFQGVWNAIKNFIHQNTVAKTQLARSKRKIRALFENCFPEELTEWLITEIALNKQRPLPATQREFWKAPPCSSDHDPRGCPSYVKKYMNSDYSEGLKVHKPHPNIIDNAKKDIKLGEDFLNVPEPLREEYSTSNDGSSDEEENGLDTDLKIDKEFQIPENATKIQM